MAHFLSSAAERVRHSRFPSTSFAAPNNSERAQTNRISARGYPLKNIDAHLVVQQVADYLGIKLTPPNANSPAFPAPADNDGFTSSSTSATSTGNNYSSGNTTSGASTRSRFVPSLPMDAPVSEGGYGKTKNAIYVERNTNALVVRATEAQHEELAKYIANHDALEKQLVIEAKILEIDIDRALELGLDWNFSGGNRFGQGSAELVNGGLNAVYGYTAGGAILSQRQVSATLKALETNKVSTTVSNARVVTRSGMAALINNSVETPIEVSTVFGGEGFRSTEYTAIKARLEGRVAALVRYHTERMLYMPYSSLAAMANTGVSMHTGHLHHPAGNDGYAKLYPYTVTTTLSMAGAGTPNERICISTAIRWQEPSPDFSEKENVPKELNLSTHTRRRF